MENAQPAGSRLVVVRVAGARVGVLRRLSTGAHEVAVYRAATGAQSFSAPAPAGLAPEDVDVQEDGTVAVVARDRDDSCESGVLSWYSEAEPFEHRVEGVQPCPNGVRLAAGRAAVFEGTGEARQLRAHDLRTSESRTLVLLRGVDHPRLPRARAPFPVLRLRRRAGGLRPPGLLGQPGPAPDRRGHRARRGQLHQVPGRAALAPRGQASPPPPHPRRALPAWLLGRGHHPARPRPVGQHGLLLARPGPRVSAYG